LEKQFINHNKAAKPESGKDDGGDDAGKKDENVVDADFEEVKTRIKKKAHKLTLNVWGN
jgi:hypothetical protein